MCGRSRHLTPYRDTVEVPDPIEPDRGESARATSHVRASDAERESVVSELRRHAGAGRLSVEELDQRAEAALAARERGQLDRLLSDLPGTPRRTQRGPQGRRAHLRVFVLVNLMLIVIWAVSGAGPFWPVWPLLGWGLGLLMHYTGALWRACHREARHIGGRYAPGPILHAGPNDVVTGPRS